MDHRGGPGRPRCPLSLRRAPLLKIVPFFALGILAEEWLRIPPAWIAVALASLWMPVLSLDGLEAWRAGRWRRIVIAAAVFVTVALTGALRLGLQHAGIDQALRLADGRTERRISGRVTDPPKVRGEGVRFDLADLEKEGPSGWTVLAGGVRVWVKGPPFEIGKGDRVEITGRIRRPDGRRNPAGFDYRSYLVRRGTWGLVSVYDRGKIQHRGSTRHGWLSRRVFHPLKLSWDDCLERHLRGRPLAMAGGLLLGERERFTPELLRTLRDAGVLHILTVSGLHVGLVVGAVLLFGKAFRIPLTLRVALALIACFFYAGIVGNRAPVVRASIMAAAALGGVLLQRDSAGVNTLCLAGMVLLAIHPGSLWEIGFQLSFGAVFGIVAFFPTLRGFGFLRALRRRRGISWVLDGVLVSLSAQLGVGPLVAYHFSQWTPVSLLANLVVLPQVGVALPLAAVAVMTSGISDTLALIPFAALWTVLEVLWRTAEPLSRIPGGSWVVRQPDVWMIVAVYAGAILGFVSLSLRRWKGIVMAAVGIMIVFLLYVDPVRPDRLRVTALDVKFGCAAAVQCPSGEVILIDGGDRSEYRDYGEQVVVPYLKSEGIRELDWVILTHPHKDHFGGLRAVIEELDVRAVLDPGLVAPSEEYRDFLRTLRARHVDFRIARKPGEIVLGEDAVLEIIPIDPASPCASLGRENVRLNNGSLVLRLRYRDTVVLLPGDIEAGRELDLLRSGVDLDSDVIVVPHHGSDSSSLPEFVNAVSPEIAIVSVGKRGRQRLPSREVIDRYRAAGARVLRTDCCGAVILVSDGQTVRVDTVIGNEVQSRWERMSNWAELALHQVAQAAGLWVWR